MDLLNVVLGIIGTLITVGGAIARGVAAYQRVDELIADIDTSLAQLTIDLDATDKAKTLAITQADETLERERTRILAEEDEVAAKLADDIRQAGLAKGQSEEAIQAQIDSLEANRAAAVADAERRKVQASESRDLTVTNLRNRMAAGDIEAQRKVAQITASKEQFLSQIHDEAIVVLNKHAGDAEYAITSAGAKEATEVGQASARLASSAVRRTGTPLLALLQVERQAKADYEQAQREASYGVQSTALGYGQKVETTRMQATQQIEDVMAQNAMSDSQMDDEIEQAQLDFTHTYANLGASEEDINRVAAQDTAALQAKLDNADPNYQEQLKNLNRDAENAKAALEAELAGVIEANKQRKENVTAQADVLTQKYRQQVADLGTKRSDLEKNRVGSVLTAAFGGVPEIFKSATDLIATIRNQTKPVIK